MFPPTPIPPCTTNAPVVVDVAVVAFCTNTFPLIPTPPYTNNVPVLVEVATMLGLFISIAMAELVTVVAIPSLNTNRICVPLVNVPNTKSPKPDVAF